MNDKVFCLLASKETNTNFYMTADGFVEIEEEKDDWRSHNFQMTKLQLLELRDFLNEVVKDES